MSENSLKRQPSDVSKSQLRGAVQILAAFIRSDWVFPPDQRSVINAWRVVKDHGSYGIEVLQKQEILEEIRPRRS